jgi:hypothetical protein
MYRYYNQFSTENRQFYEGEMMDPRRFASSTLSLIGS